MHEMYHDWQFGHRFWGQLAYLTETKWYGFRGVPAYILEVMAYRHSHNKLLPLRLAWGSLWPYEQAEVIFWFITGSSYLGYNLFGK